MKPLFVIFALLYWQQIRAEQVFLMFESECGDLIKYARSMGQVTKMDYLAYSFSLSPSFTLILETDTEGLITRQDLPSSYLDCGSDALDATLAERINNGAVQAFVITLTESGAYAQQPVMMAGTITRQETQVSYNSPLASFIFDEEDAVIGVDLDRSASAASVFFDGREGNQCSSAYLFQQQHPGSAYPTINYKLLPQLGILEREMIGEGNYSGQELITATKVNDQPLEQYLSDLCTSAPEVSYTEVQHSFVPYYVEQHPTTAQPVAEVAATQDQRTTGDQYSAPPSLPQRSATSVHEVRPGETLYAISRQSRVGVEELKILNGLSSNTIYVGQQLRLGGDEPAPTAPTEVLVDHAAIAPSQTSPASLYVSSERLPTEASLHTVKPGETIASIALRYGYTTERFRRFNGLAEGAVALVGQQLNTSHCSCPTAETSPVQPSNSGAATPVYASNYPASPSASIPIVVPPARPISGPEVGAPPAYTGGQDYYSAPAPPASPTSRPAESHPVHVVREGDSLFGIARQYGTTVDQLRSLNELMPADVIVPFQKLYVN